MKSHKLMERNLKYKGHRVKVYEDVLESPEGEKLYYDFVENRNGAGVLLVDNDGLLIFVKQYRNALGTFDLEIPAGCAETIDSESVSEPINDIDVNEPGSDLKKYNRSDFEKSENPFYKCALREAEEETGMIPTKLTFVNYIIAAVGLFSERTAVYIGENLKRGEMNRDFDEYIEIVRLSLEEALEYIYEGKIIDSKTIIAIQAYAALLNKK